MNATVGGLFDGCGLLAYGLHLAGWEHRWLCEVDEFRQGILRQRFPGVPVYPDVRAVDGSAERPVLVAGGFPCKGGSTAGKREGLDHPETALWHEMARVVRDVRPRFVLIENVANLLAVHDGAVWGTVLGDLATLGYDTEWDCLPAAAFGAPHLRDRVFAIATDASAGGLGVVERHIHAWEPDAARCDPLATSDADVPRWPAGRITESEGPGFRGARRRPEHRAGGNGAASDAAVERRDETAGGTERVGLRASGGGADPRTRRPPGDERGVAVAWGPHAPAVERWERVHGAAPEPLVHRVDDRGAARVERSRLSALGDGVQVQVGYFMGRLIMDRLP